MKLQVKLLSAQYPYLSWCRYSGSGSDWRKLLIGNYAFIRPGTIISNGVKMVLPPKLKMRLLKRKQRLVRMFYCRLGSCKPGIFGRTSTYSNHRLDEQPVSVRTPEGIIAPDAIN